LHCDQLNTTTIATVKRVLARSDVAPQNEYRRVKIPMIFPGEEAKTVCYGKLVDDLL
jgi:hypothetical protein